MAVSKSATPESSDAPMQLAQLSSRLDILAAETRRVTGELNTLQRAHNSLEDLRPEVENLSTLVFDKLDKAAQGAISTIQSEAPQAPGVYDKIAQVMNLVAVIGKERKTDHKGGNYRYRGVDDAMDEVGHAVRQVGLIFSTNVISTEYDVRVVGDRVWTSARITMRYTFIDPADGSTHSGTMAGEGRDMGDKATSKAEAMALKYFLFQALLIPVEGVTGQDSELENPVIHQQSAPVAAPSRALTFDEQTEQAHRALRAARTPSSNLSAIIERVDQLDIGGVIIEGAPLSNHLNEIQRMIAPESSA